jgi:hypothetical protein
MDYQGHLVAFGMISRCKFHFVYHDVRKTNPYGRSHPQSTRKLSNHYTVLSTWVLSEHPAAGENRDAATLDIKPDPVMAPSAVGPSQQDVADLPQLEFNWTSSREVPVTGTSPSRPRQLTADGEHHLRAHSPQVGDDDLQARDVGAIPVAQQRAWPSHD